ncbi:hypothetical protein Tco_0996624 [Tanacetum coccineum]
MEKWIELANHLMTRWRMGTERHSHKQMNGTTGPDQTRDSDNQGNRQKEWVGYWNLPKSPDFFEAGL